MRATGILFFCLAAVVSLAGCGVQVSAGGADSEPVDSDDSKTEEAVPVEVATLEHGPIEAILRFSANLEAEHDVLVFAEAPRQVVELLVEEGDQVARDQLLLRLEDDVQRSNLAKVESQQRRARRELDRQRELFEQNLISEQVFNDASYEVEQLELQLSDARRDLSYTEVRSPFTGTITERWVSIGDQVTLNQQLFRIIDFDSIVARIYVPEKELNALSSGQTARITADALNSRAFAGSVDRIAPAVDPNTGTVKVTVAIPRQQGLRPGMYVVVELVTAVHEEAVLVPKRALIYDNDQIFLFRLGDERRVERLRVSPLIESADFIEPVAGVEAGQEVVVAGQTGLKDGALVRLPGDPVEAEAGDTAASDDTSSEEVMS